MGRPLKIKKTTTKDIGFNAFSQLTNPVYPSTFNTSQFLGVVGGTNAQAGASVATTAYPVVKCRVYIEGAAAEDDGYIITQKGQTKYLVAAVSAVNDESMVVGLSYRILTVGTTNWTACGASKANPAAGDIFVCGAAGSGTGTAQLVGVCLLANEAQGALTEGNMNISYSDDASSEVLISKLTNKYAYDYSNVRYLANFFSDEGTEIISGTKGETINLVIVEKYTS